MKQDSKKRNNDEKESKHSIKALARTAILAGGLLISPHLAARPAEAEIAKDKPIKDRVEAIREALKKKLADGASPDSELSYSEIEVAQWGNWGNWGNWNNWLNWNNWNNWVNWNNWGNWRNI
ncbi:MAG TPA: hypothetical protein VN282_17110 [Pyrinomonadaceae bacterium]|nr:hypothetical protein [Pyrinomonadaceae bacterium]